jgi:putative methanogenesis marker protein 8
MSNEHVVEAMGRTRVVFRNGKVVKVSKPKIKSCPLWKRFGVTEFTQEVVKQRIEEFTLALGFFTDRRPLEVTLEVDFGVSEMMSTAQESGMLDCAVEVCDGAGTMVVRDPELTEAIGGPSAGLVKTSSVQAIIKKLEERGVVVLNPLTAEIDQVLGVKKAVEMGCKSIGVTVTSPEDAKKIRDIEKESKVNITIFGVHLTGLSKEEILGIVDNADIITACASKWTREIAGKRALIQLGSKVPMFGLTVKGKKLLLKRAEKLGKQLLIQTATLPSLTEEQPEPLI